MKIIKTMSCNTGLCNLGIPKQNKRFHGRGGRGQNRGGFIHEYHYSSDTAPVRYVQKEFRSSVPRRLKKKNLDLAYDQCYTDYVIIKREVPDRKTKKYIIVDYDPCECKKNFKCNPCRKR